MSEKSKGFGVLPGTAGDGALADIGYVDTYGKMPWISFTLKNTHASAALSSVAILVKDKKTGDYSTLVSGADWDTASNFSDMDRIGLSNSTQASIRILPAGEYVHVCMFIGPAYAFKIQAQDAGGGVVTTELSGYAAGQ